MRNNNKGWKASLSRLYGLKSIDDYQESDFNRMSHRSLLDIFTVVPFANLILLIIYFTDSHFSVKKLPKAYRLGGRG